MDDPTDPTTLRDKTAWLYYVDRLNQQEIADRLHISRTRVWRLLQEALRLGIVEIRVDEAVSRHMRLVRELEDQFGLREAIVVPGSGDDLTDRKAIGRAAAGYLQRAMPDPYVLGMGVGLSVSEIAGYIQPSHHHAEGLIIGISGGFSYPEISSMEVCTRLAERLGARAEHIFAPFIVDSPGARAVLLEDRTISEQIQRAAGCDLMITGVGAFGPENHFARLGYLDEETLRDLQERGAVGEVMARFFDINGRLLPCPLDERLIGLDMEQIRRIPVSAIMASGANKATAILGALRSGYFKVLITDDRAAREVLRLNTSNPPAAD